jgi:hypothetical protein
VRAHQSEEHEGEDLHDLAQRVFLGRARDEADDRDRDDRKRDAMKLRLDPEVADELRVHRRRAVRTWSR